MDVDGTTTFQIRLRNYGTKEATKLQVSAKLSDNLVVDSDRRRARRRRVRQGWRGQVPDHRAPGAGQGDDLAIKVKVTKPQPKIGTCRIFLLHDDLTEALEDMAGVKVTESRRAASTSP